MGSLLTKVINTTTYYILLFPLKIYKKSNNIEDIKKNEDDVIIEWGQFIDFENDINYIDYID